MVNNSRATTKTIDTFIVRLLSLHGQSRRCMTERCIEEVWSSLRNLFILETVGRTRTCASSGIVRNVGSLSRRSFHGYNVLCPQLASVFIAFCQLREDHPRSWQNSVVAEMLGILRLDCPEKPATS